MGERVTRCGGFLRDLGFPHELTWNLCSQIGGIVWLLARGVPSLDARAKDVAEKLHQIRHANETIFVDEQELFFSACDSYVQTRARPEEKCYGW